MSEIKCAGRFLYRYRADNTVAIAKKSIFSSLASQMIVIETMSSIAKPTGHYCNMVYDGKTYVGVIFMAIPEDQLIAVLEQNY